jgi:hypothetical protein
MGFTLRMVVLEATGRPGIILETRRLKARTVEEAKVEADSSPWNIGEIQPTGFEILDGDGVIVARRRYMGKAVYVPWSKSI